MGKRFGFANNELALHVADPIAAARFYVDVMGCRLVDPNPQCVELETGALRLFLVPDPAPTHEPLVPSFSVPDRAKALDLLQAPGALWYQSARTPPASTTYATRMGFCSMWPNVRKRSPRAPASIVSRHQ